MTIMRLTQWYSAHKKLHSKCQSLTTMSILYTLSLAS
jgi:hypothetical protein